MLKAIFACSVTGAVMLSVAIDCRDCFFKYGKNDLSEVTVFPIGLEKPTSNKRGSRRRLHVVFHPLLHLLG